MLPAPMLPPPDRTRRILTLALPIIGSMMSQNVLNLVDTAMVGSLGKEALAAVGLGGFVTFTSQAVILGLSAGVQAMAARRLGEGRDHELAVPLNGGLLLSLCVGLPLAALLYLLAPKIFALLNADPQVLALGVPYYRARLLGVVAVGMNFSYRGYWNGVGLSHMYMRTIVLMHLANVGLSYCLIFGKLGLPTLGTQGAGLGTTLSVWIGAAIYLFLGFRHARAGGFLAKLPDAESMQSLLRLSIPNSIQQLFFSLGLTTLFWIVGKVGTTELAAANVIINLTLVALLPAMGLGLAAASLVGQALGRKQPEDATRWGWEVVRVGLLLLVCLGLPYVLLPDRILSVFIHDPETLAAARAPLRLVGITIAIEAYGMVLMNALLGAGDSRNVMVVSIVTQWLLFMPVAYLVGVKYSGGLLAIWAIQAVYRGIQSATFVWMWNRGAWARIQV